MYYLQVHYTTLAKYENELLGDRRICLHFDDGQQCYHKEMCHQMDMGEALRSQGGYYRMKVYLKLSLDILESCSS